MQQIEAFTAGGVVSGAVAQTALLRDGPDANGPVDVDLATWYPISGEAAERRPRMHVEHDDLLVLCAETEDLPIHASWHLVELEVGPYHLTGELPTLPGFDPNRALSRPGGPFVLLRDVRVDLVGHPDGGSVERPHALVNRYAVEQVSADIELGFYFPGARFSAGHGRPPA